MIILIINMDKYICLSLIKSQMKCYDKICLTSITDESLINICGHVKVYIICKPSISLQIVVSRCQPNSNGTRIAAPILIIWKAGIYISSALFNVGWKQKSKLFRLFISCDQYIIGYIFFYFSKIIYFLIVRIQLKM